MNLIAQSQKIYSIDFSEDKVNLLRNTVCKNATDDELQLFLHVCSRTGLDPFRNQIYAIKRKDRMTIQTGIDGFRLIAERTEKYAPGREPSYTYDQQGKLVSATAYIKKQTSDGSWHEVSATAFWNEYVVSYNGKPSDFWNRMPHNQLAKCAESLALRKAFPADYSGLYSTEEMGQADNDQAINVNAVREKNSEVIQIESDLTPEELNTYLTKNWSEVSDNFKLFMHEIMFDKKWNYRKCIEILDKHKEYTEKTFNEWLAKKKV